MVVFLSIWMEWTANGWWIWLRYGLKIIAHKKRGWKKIASLVVRSKCYKTWGVSRWCRIKRHVMIRVWCPLPRRRCIIHSRFQHNHTSQKGSMQRTGILCLRASSASSSPANGGHDSCVCWQWWTHLALQHRLQKRLPFSTAWLRDEQSPDNRPNLYWRCQNL